VDSNDRLQAYLHARHIQAFRRLLWARLAVGLLVWLVVALVISLSREALFVGVAMIAVPAVWALRVERQATSDFCSRGR